MQHLDICSPVSVAVAAIVIFLSVVYYFIKNRDILPGPTGLPFFGIHPFLDNDRCNLQMEEYGKKYGDLYSFTSFGKLLINLGSAKAIREFHVNKSDCFAGRFETFNILTYALPDGVGMTNGESWKVQRKFFIQAFKEYGLSAIRENTVGPIFDSLSTTIDDLKSRNGVPFNVIELLTDKCTGTIRKVVFGEESITDEKMHEMIQSYMGFLEGVTGTKMLMFGPVAKFLFKIIPKFRRVIDAHAALTQLLLEAVKKIESKMDENHPTCVIEDFYKEQRKRRKNNDPTWKYFTDQALVSSVTQIVGDGILSVAYFIGCFLYALVEHPEEQEKLYQELLEVLGPSRLPEPEDRINLPYTNAFMQEVIRTSNFFPLFPNMECTKETTVRGYRIPKGSITLNNAWMSHHDPDAYEEPHRFDPSRFIPKEGKPKAESTVEFGLGKRVCAGEPFVMLQAFLFLTSIIKNFTISEPNAKSKSGHFLMTGVMELSIVPRKEI